MKIISHTVKPKIPAALAPLEEIAHNLWLSWNFEAIMDAFLASLSLYRDEPAAGLVEALRGLARGGLARANIRDDASLLLIERGPIAARG